MRLFAGIALPAAQRDHLASALEMVRPPAHAARNPWEPSANWHVTLGFYGEQPDGMMDELADNLRLAAARTAPFTLALAGAGLFRHDVGWIGVTDPARALGPLAERVRGTYATLYQSTQNRFHVTVTRAGRQAGLAPTLAALAVYRGPEWTVGEITLFRSDLHEGIGGHPRYTVLATAQLA
ncbi:MAG: RNA 2',3'-cyclic phosphodiesterase [Propionibacteriaceae bacterium]|nr:RNA 2',3'-cyclic phosphodiesterase [Propionibacteriaceae bacterium]